MKKLSALLTAAIAVAMAITGCGNSGNASDTVYIVTDLTRSAGSGFEYYGNEVYNGINLLKEDFRKLNVELIDEDNMGTTKETVLVFNKYSIRKDVPLIITNNSPLSKAVRTFAEESSINHMALVAGDLDLCDGFDWVFRDAIMQNQEGEVLGNYVKSSTDFKTISMCGVNDDYGIDGMGQLKLNLEGSGIKILDEIKYEKGNFDFSFILTNILSKKPDAIYFAGREQYIISFINQLRERNKDIPVMVCDAFDSPTVIDGLGDNAKGVVFASYDNDLEAPESKEFVNAYQNAYGSTPGIYAIDAYVCAQYLVDIISDGNRTAKQIKKALEKMTFDSSLKGHLVVENHSIISHVTTYVIDALGEKKRI